MSKVEIQSLEELHFSWMLEELKAEGYIREYTLQPKALQMFEGKQYSWLKSKPTKKDPNRVEEKTNWLLEPAEYTADAHIIWEHKAQGIFFTLERPRHNKCKLFVAHMVFDKEDTLDWQPHTYVEIKPIFDMQNMTRVFISKQKWIYQLHDIYINLVTPIKLFTNMFTPTRYLFTDKGKQSRKIKHEVITLNEYIENMKIKNNLIG